MMLLSLEYDDNVWLLFSDVSMTHYRLEVVAKHFLIYLKKFSVRYKRTTHIHAVLVNAQTLLSVFPADAAGLN